VTVLLTGATGFTGSHVLSLLLEKGIRPRCLVRPSSDVRDLRRAGVEIFEGDIGDERSLLEAMHGIDTLLNTASLGFGHAPVLVSCAERAGVRRAVFISTTAIFTSLNASSKVVRLAAEECVQQSALRQTIIRPTMIYGTSRDRNMARLINFLQWSPVMPIIGSDRSLLQPVHVRDVAFVAVAAMESNTAIGRAYNIAGATALTFVEVIDTITRLLGRHVIKVRLPLRPISTVLRALERIGVHLRVKREQILRLNEDKAFDYSDAARDLGYSPLSFEEGIRCELDEMRLLTLSPRL
jgi:nucleoside-diphosphate-sugar epimerase